MCSAGSHSIYPELVITDRVSATTCSLNLLKWKGFALNKNACMSVLIGEQNVINFSPTIVFTVVQKEGIEDKVGVILPFLIVNKLH